MERSVIDLSKYRLESADYLDFFVASKEEAAAQIQRAEAFKEWIEEYLRSRQVL